MSNDRLILPTDQNSDFINPTYIATLASRIYNEVPGVAEALRNLSDVNDVNPARSATPSVEPYSAAYGTSYGANQAVPTASSAPNCDFLKSQQRYAEPQNISAQGFQNQAPSQGDTEFLDLSVFNINNVSPSFSGSQPSGNISDLKNFYFYPDGVPSEDGSLSQHTNNLVSQQALKPEQETNYDLNHFVTKAQAVSNGLGQSGNSKTSTSNLGSELWGDDFGLGFLKSAALSFGTSPLETNNDFYFLGNKPSLGYTETFDVHSIRKDFPILHQNINGKPLVWFDNAATTQKPQSVIDTLKNFYERDNSNIHRAAHTLAARSTDAYEGAREKVRKFIGASSTDEIIFVRGTTEGINLVAQTWGRQNIQPGDEILISLVEHHANIVPWQMLAKEKGAILKAIPVNDDGEILFDEYQRLLTPRVKLLAVTQASNGLGTILPVKEMIQLAKRYDIKVLVDGAQSVAHLAVNVQELNADFFVFSGHKIFAPNGIGVVYGKRELLEKMPPWQGGGNMIKDVRLEETQFNGIPNKFEAGTPNVADAVGLGVALDYVSKIGLNNIARYEHELTEYGTQQLLTIPGLRIIGTAKEKVGVLSFVLPPYTTEQIGKYLDQEGIAVRAGHHCTQPALRRFGVESTVRPSFSLYNTKEEIDRMVDALRRIRGRQL